MACRSFSFDNHISQGSIPLTLFIPNESVYGSQFFDAKIAKRLFEGHGETEIFFCCLRIWDVGRLFIKIYWNGEKTIIKYYGRVLNCNFKNISNNYYFFPMFSPKPREKLQ
jgi:hypothetical protein